MNIPVKEEGKKEGKAGNEMKSTWILRTSTLKGQERKMQELKLYLWLLHLTFLKTTRRTEERGINNCNTFSLFFFVFCMWVHFLSISPLPIHQASKNPKSSSSWRQKVFTALPLSPSSSRPCLLVTIDKLLISCLFSEN